MELFVGGIAQGKLDYVLREKNLPEECVRSGEDLPADPPAGVRILRNFEQYVRRLIEDGTDPVLAAEKLTERNPDICIISNEIGSGVIPADDFERIWRDTTGRVLCILAGKAEHVTRIVCGLGQKLK
ncbi:MAG: bifunctional adenosylcobinamide kinase/adenosylcobinamide-phosphate guanylyltransferase [Lachnospiraceae bacterium]|jgi:adenosylcobinamide kinase/adenosylcobinamide-phosphate guanylyltransferase|nr:bifunctional adenosylcobinamide kinase/adenosylcobinamide-phosphate guanylyltransferase [Lachnospiraceae bacterium]